jgi:hypothetical protein
MQQPVTNHFVSPGKFKEAFYTFVYETENALDNKYAVNVAISSGELVCFLTFASSFQDAFSIAKRVYQAAAYPLVGVDHFVVWGISKSSTCPLGGESHALLFIVDWSTTN